MTLDELERRLSEATGPDHDLGVAVYETLDICSYIPDEGDPTASLDAAVALCEGVLPGWGWFIRHDEDGFNASMLYPNALRVSPGCGQSKHSAPLALLLATVRALKAKG